MRLNIKLTGSVFRILLTVTLFLCSFSKNFAGNGKIDAMGNMSFSVNFRYVPTAADITRLQNALRDANNIICDATDGQARFGTIRITAGAADEDEADIWVYAEDGRSGASYFIDGASFGTLGDHIGLYQNDINGGVIAHELGHHAFGLGDEYDEQCRWGGPCGIGPCLDAGSALTDELMQQTGNSSELCTAGSHDPLRGNNVLCPASTCMGTCVDADCKTRWNSVSNRFETSEQMLSHPGLSCWETLDQNYPSIFTPPAGLPVNAPPTNCGTPTFDVKVTGSDQIMLFIDRSGSMFAKLDPAAPASANRLDFAKAAARVFIDLRAGTGAQVGLVSFEETPTLDRKLIDLPAADATAFKTKVDGLAAGGNTAIGTALNASIFEFQGAAAAGRTRTAFLLSDGENNRGSDPQTAADQLKNMGVRIFTIPVGSAADRTLLSNIASATGGTMLNADQGDELPSIYFKLFALSKGEGLVLDKKPMAVRAARNINRDFSVSTNPNNPSPLADIDSVSFFVEKLGQKLNIVLSARNAVISTWGPSFRLVSPGGTVFTSANTSIIKTDPYYILINLASPEQGTWKLYVTSNNNFDQFLFASAHVEDPLPDLFVAVKPVITTFATPVAIAVNSSYKIELDSGVIYTGHVKRPDGSTVPLTFTRNNYSRAVSAAFTNYNFRGIYEVYVKVKVTETTKPIIGESIFPGPGIAPVTVTPFERETLAYFYAKDGNFFCNTNDCDHDGIVNDIDGTFDPDGDNYPAYIDDDADGDDVPDPMDGTGDPDGDHTPNFLDPDSNNNGITDANDPPGKTDTPFSRKRLWYSWHVGSSHPLGNLNKISDPNINAQVDLSYQLRSDLFLDLFFGYSQFTADAPPGIDNPYWTNLSLNLQKVLPRVFNMKPYIKLGPGIYGNGSSTYTGINAGIGGLYGIGPDGRISIGLDVHRVFDKAKSSFINFNMGILFR